MAGFAEIAFLQAPQTTTFQAITYLPRLFFIMFVNRLLGFRILHIHWLYSFSLPNHVPGNKEISYLDTAIFIYFARLLGYKIVWTVHNILPHEAITSNDLAIRKKLATIASAKIVHGRSSIKELDELNINTDNCHIIPVGSYKAIYDDTVLRPQARKQLGIAADEFVFVFMGQIEPYKNIPGIIDTFRRLSLSSKNIRLILAGKVSDVELISIIDNAKREFGRRLIVPGFVADEDVQVYMRAADVALYPFNNITTSSAVILALSFGIPVIAPRLGVLEDLPENISYFYDPSEADGLLKSARMAMRNGEERQIKAGLAAAYDKNLSWDKIAAKTYKVYQEVLSPDAKEST